MHKRHTLYHTYQQSQGCTIWEPDKNAWLQPPWHDHIIYEVTSVLFNVLLVILNILAEQEDDWKLDWMNIVVKLKMKRFIPHPLPFIVGFTIIILILQRLVRCLLPFPLLIWIFTKLSTFWKILTISLMTSLSHLQFLRPGNCLFDFFLQVFN